jgi:chromosome partitioning protein
MTSSTHGLGWPERALRRLRPRAAAGPPTEQGAPGLGWPGAREIDSPAAGRATVGLGSGTADDTARQSVADRRTADVPEPAVASVTRVTRGSADDGLADGGVFDGDGDGSPVPDRVRQALSGVSRETGPDDVIAAEREVPVVYPASADTPIARAARAAVVARSGGENWQRPSSCRIITIANQKGGVGKTTTAVNLAAALAMHGSRVLVVDLDPQGNASTALDIEHHSGVTSVYDVLVEDRPLGGVIRPVAGFAHLYCAPASIDLAGAEIELVPLVARESRLARALGGFDVSNLDYIFIDCPPSLGLLTVNALVAAPEVLIPIQCEYYALEGLEQLLRTIELVRSHLNPALSVTTILLTMYDGRTRLASQVADEVREHFGAVVLDSVIPRSVRVSEAPSYGQSVMTYDPGSSGAQSYLEAARELAIRNAGLPA